jgi:hypothetical protein
LLLCWCIFNWMRMRINYGLLAVMRVASNSKSHQQLYSTTNKAFFNGSVMWKKGRTLRRSTPRQQ